VLLAVDDVRLGGAAVRRGQQHLLHDVLHALDRKTQGVLQRMDQRHHFQSQAPRLFRRELAGGLARLLNGRDDLLGLKRLDPPVPFLNAKDPILLHQFIHA